MVMYLKESLSGSDTEAESTCSLKSTRPKLSRLATRLALTVGASPRKLKRKNSVSVETISEGMPSPPPPGEMTSPAPPDCLDRGGGEEDLEEASTGIDSNMFLYGVLLACIIVQIWQRLWLMRLLVVPVLYYGAKWGLCRIGVLEWMNQTFKNGQEYLQSHKLNELIVPPPFRTFLRILSLADAQFLGLWETHADSFATVSILIFVILGAALFLVFAAIQTYVEGDHLVRVSIDLANATIHQHPELSQLLPTGWESMLSSVVDNGYTTGKEYITNTIRDLVEDREDPAKAAEIERQVIELWDTIYLSWNRTWAEGRAVNETQHGFEWKELVETGKNVPSMLHYSIILDVIKANLGTLMSLLDSFWNVFVGNMTLALSSVTAVLSLLFGSTSTLLNLLLNLIIFFTGLFYLLSSSSSSLYMPVDLLLTLVPSEYATRFLFLVEESVNGVFTASLKMSLFYGMWTWLVHSLFSINILFVPSILASLFASVPLLTPYWAGLPAVLELLLIQREWIKGGLLMLLLVAPMMVVDAQIYSEIKGGGHPYLTGLAVAGGVYWFGIQGSVCGPMILCVVVVGVKVLKEWGWGLNQPNKRPSTT